MRDGSFWCSRGQICQGEIKDLNKIRAFSNAKLVGACYLTIIFHPFLINSVIKLAIKDIK